VPGAAYAIPKTRTSPGWTEFDKYASKDLEKDHSRILFSQSLDTGKSWSEAVAISQFEGNCLDNDDTTEGAVPAYGPNGEIYVAWSYKEKIWFDRSTDGGKTWLDKDILAAKQPGGWEIDIAGLNRSNVMPILVCDRSKPESRNTLPLLGRSAQWRGGHGYFHGKKPRWRTYLERPDPRERRQKRATAIPALACH